MSAFRTTAKTSHLKDNSWIRKPNNEDEPVDDDPNFGKAVLSRRKSNDILESSEPVEPTPTKTTSVHELSKRFTGSQRDLETYSTLPPTKTSYTKSTYSSVNPDSPTLTTTTKTTVTEYPKTSTKTTAVTKDGTTTETIITTTESVRSPVSKTPVSSETFSERVKSSTKGQQYPTYSPTKTTTKVIEKTITSTQDQEDKPYNPLSIKDSLSPTDSEKTSSTTETVVLKSSYDTNKSTVSTTETVTLRSSSTDDVFRTTTTENTSSTAEDKLYDILLPSSVRSDSYSPISTSSITKSETIIVESSRGKESPTMTRNLSSYSSYSKDTPSTRTTSYTVTTSDNYSSDRNTYTYSRPDSSYEYTSITSPSVYTSSTYRSRSRSDDILSDPAYSSSSVKSVYASPERTVLEKDLCTTCRKPFTVDAKMVLDDIKIKCHASCFKCEVCNITLGNLKAGDSLWIYKRMVHCENCFEVTKEKWRR
ncbi:sciellin isoform X3 [Archocentrus centrarchus]|uniref:sciellin isoform X3 n=1 Tax=Archocentrus centrarchus TaxID=63155 RepID=UPI0011E9FC7C|nr:sciellin isoform X3 [Archocentrus centrarchus]